MEKRKSGGNKTGPILIIIAAAMWGSTGVFVRIFQNMGLGAIEASAMRNIGAAIPMLLITLLRNPKEMRIKKGDIPYLMGAGIVSIVFFTFCYFKAIQVMDLSAAAILLYTAPIFVMLMSVWLFREKLTAAKAAALVLAFSGCILVSGILGTGAKNPLSPAGILFGLGAGIGYALYSIFSRFCLNRGLRSMTITVYAICFAAIGSGLLADWSVIAAAFQKVGPAYLAWVLLYGFFTETIPYLCYTRGLESVENGPASVMATVEPAVATVLGMILYHEYPGVSGWIGIGLVFLAIITLTRAQSCRKATPD